MVNWQWMLDLAVAILLAATLLRAWRLDRALAALRQDRTAMGALTESFDATMREAASGVAALRDAADEAMRRVHQQSAAAVALHDDLSGVVERGERLAERLDHALRAMRRAAPTFEIGSVQIGSAGRPAAAEDNAVAAPERGPGHVAGHDTRRDIGRDGARVRSQAERDLLLALQARS